MNHKDLEAYTAEVANLVTDHVTNNTRGGEFVEKLSLLMSEFYDRYGEEEA